MICIFIGVIDLQLHSKHVQLNSEIKFQANAALYRCEASTHAEILKNFFDWVRKLMPICGGKDVHFNVRTVIKGALEGFPRWPTD